MQARDDDHDEFGTTSWDVATGRQAYLTCSVTCETSPPFTCTLTVADFLSRHFADSE
jgi:hypothetical protein